MRGAAGFALFVIAGCHDLGAVNKPQVEPMRDGASSPLPDAGPDLPPDRAGEPDVAPDQAPTDAGGPDLSRDLAVPDRGPAVLVCNNDGECPTNQRCLLQLRECAPREVIVRGNVRRYESLDALAYRSGVTVRLTNMVPQLMSPATGADGAFTVMNVPPGSIADVELAFEQADPVFVPPSIRTRLAARFGDDAQQALTVSAVPYAWMARVAFQCGLFATEAEATGQSMGAVNTYFVRRSTIFGELLDMSGNPVANVPRAAIEVLLNGQSNRHGTPADTFVCFLRRDVATSQYAGTQLSASTDTGRFVMFQVSDEMGTGRGTAEVKVTDFVSRTVTLLSSGNIGVVTLTAGRNVMPPAPMMRSFATDVYPLFKKLGCRGCHTPGQPGYEASMARGGMKLDLSGTVDQVYASLLAGGMVGCDVPTTPARVCTVRPASSLLLKKPLAEQPPAPPDHQNSTFDTTSDSDYQVILDWIAFGAARQ